MDNAGIVFRSRNSRVSKYGSRRTSSETSRDPSGLGNHSPMSSQPSAEGFPTIPPSASGAIQHNVINTGDLNARKSMNWGEGDAWFSPTSSAPGTGTIPNLPPSMSTENPDASVAGISLPSGGIDVQLLQNFQPSAPWLNSQNESSWQDLSGQPHMTGMNLMGLHESQGVPNDFASQQKGGNGPNVPSPYGLPLSPYHPLMQQQQQQQQQNMYGGGPNVNQGNGMPGRMDFDSMSQTYKLMNTNSSGSDLSLLTKPMVPTEQGPLSAEAGTPSIPSATTSEKDVAHYKCKSALDNFFGSVSAQGISTQRLADFCLRQGHTEVSPDTTGEQTSGLLSPQKHSGSTAVEAVCIRVLDKDGQVKLCPASSYYPDVPSMYKGEETVVEYPGGVFEGATRAHAPVPQKSEKSLFPAGRWSDTDYTKLVNDAQRLLTRPATPVLLSLGRGDLQHSLPFLQWDLIEHYVAAVRQPMTNEWTPVQTCQRQALLLLIAAVASTLFPAIRIPEDEGAKGMSASAWEFGFQCYYTARGLLTPRNVQLGKNEVTLDFAQSMILLNIYFTRCQQYADAFSALAHGVTTCLQLVQQPIVQQPSDATLASTILQREMVKRCLWVLCLLERLHRAETRDGSPALFSDAILSLEKPVLLRGLSVSECRPDEGLTQDAFNVFLSQLSLAQLLAEANTRGIFFMDPSTLPKGSPTYAAAHTLVEKAKRWVAETPCILRPVSTDQFSDPSAGTWTTSASINMKGLFQTTMAQVSQFTLV